jgi:uncharacterized protein (DUF433 family)
MTGMRALGEGASSIDRIVERAVERREGLVSGALVFRGTRVPVSVLFEYLEGGYSLDDFLREFPGVQREHALAVLEDARSKVGAKSPAA